MPAAGQIARFAREVTTDLRGPGSKRSGFFWPIALLGGFFAVLSAIAPSFSALPPLSRHMATHILLMNCLAPALAALWLERRPTQARAPRLLPATAVQLAALLAFHTPAVLTAAHHSAAMHLVLLVTLLCAALWFWTAALATVGAARWRSIAALLVTGKLFCLVGAVLTFAPRPLFTISHADTASAAIADQQLAGLLMLAACPPTYVLAGVVIATLWLGELGQEAPAHRGPTPDGLVRGEP